MSVTHQPEYWLQAQHLKPECISQYRHSIKEHPAGMVYIHDFLKPEHAKKLSCFLTQEVAFKKFYSIKPATKADNVKEQSVDQETYLATRAEQQFVSLGQFDHHKFTLKPEAARSRSAMQFMLLLKAWEQAPLLTYFSLITGQSHVQGGFRFCQLMQQSDVIHYHEDHGHVYQFFSTLFLTPNWEADYGGIFHTTSAQTGEEFTIVPRYNSILLFDLNRQGGHWVTPVESHPNNTGRSSIHAGIATST